MIKPPKPLDLTGYRCPVPVIRLEAALRQADQDTQLLVFADDPIAMVDIPHSCREGGHSCTRLPDRGSICVFQVTRGPKP